MKRTSFLLVLALGIQAFPISAADKDAPKVEPAKNAQEAIDRGKSFLRPQLEALLDGTTKPEGILVSQHEGLIAFMAWTLLECGVPPDDPIIVKAAITLRNRYERLERTYSLAATIFFFDRFDGKHNKDVIQTCALRLMAGQNVAGIWEYDCPLLDKQDEQQLLALVTAAHANKAADLVKVHAALPSHLKALPMVQAIGGTRPQIGASGDNSNTQFAVLALWMAQRHEVLARFALLQAAFAYRGTQNADGSWGYMGARGNRWKNSMTCSGLLGLAIGHGLGDTTKEAKGKDKKAAQKPGKDPAIEKAFQFLSQKIAPREDERKQLDAKGTPGRGTVIGADAHGDLYYLWSLQRVALIYELEKIGDQDWHAWATQLLLQSQRADGSWQDVFPPTADTCFALLILKRANAVPDLNVKKIISIKHPEAVDK